MAQRLVAIASVVLAVALTLAFPAPAATEVCQPVEFSLMAMRDGDGLVLHSSERLRIAQTASRVGSGRVVLGAAAGWTAGPDDAVELVAEAFSKAGVARLDKVIGSTPRTDPGDSDDPGFRVFVSVVCDS